MLGLDGGGRANGGSQPHCCTFSRPAVLHASAQGSCCSGAKELTQVLSVFGFVLGGEVPVTVQLLRLPAQMRMRFVTLTREALENGDACAFLTRRSKHASVKDVIFKLQEPVGKALRPPFFSLESGPLTLVRTEWWALHLEQLHW